MSDFVHNLILPQIAQRYFPQKMGHTDKKLRNAGVNDTNIDIPRIIAACKVGISLRSEIAPNQRRVWEETGNLFQNVKKPAASVCIFDIFAIQYVYESS